MAFGQYQTPYYNPYAPQQPFGMTAPMPGAMPAVPAPMQSQAQAQPASVAAGNGLVWVGSRQEEQIYPVAPGCAVPLWDANAPYVYIRQADGSGKPSFNAFKLVAADEEPEGEYATKKELEELKAELRALLKEAKKDE